MSRRLYLEDSYRTTFESSVVRRFPVGDSVGIVLEETCFYPTSGGQHCDLGELGGIAVQDVRLEGGEVIHVLPEDPAGDVLRGTIHWTRRFDHMQQHSGQHVLSQSFLQVLALDTVSSHLGTETSTIELPAQKVSREDMHRVETEANRIVFANLPIQALEMSFEEAQVRGVRKFPEKEGQLRIVEVEGYDLSACGGTHCRSTGEIGLIKVGRTERIRKQTRVEFLCGWRALRDYRSRSGWLEEAALTLGRHPSDVPGEVQRLLDEAGRTRKGIARLEEDLLAYRAKEMLAETPLVGDVRVVKAACDMSGDGLAVLARHLASQAGTVALLGTPLDGGRVAVARSDDVDLDLGARLRDVIGTWGGKGGGKPALARGGVDPEKLEGFLAELEVVVRRDLGRKPE